MLYSLLFCIGSLIVLLMVAIKYFGSIKNITNLVLRQQIFIVLFIIAVISILADIMEGIFFVKELIIPYTISWKIHWLFTYIVFFLIYYYFIVVFKIEKTESWKSLLLDKKIISFKNVYGLFTILVYILVIIYINPIKFGNQFEFIPMKYAPFILVSSSLYGIFLIEIVFKYFKDKENFNKKYVLTLVTCISGILIAVGFQILIPNFAFLGLGLYSVILVLYFVIENLDIVVSSDIEIIDKNIANIGEENLYNLPYITSDIKNQLTEMKISLDNILKNPIQNIEQEKYELKKIKHCSKYINDILNNTINNKNNGIKIETCNLNDFLYDIPNIMKAKINKKSIKFEMTIDQSIASELIIDKEKLEFIINSILENAIEYTEVGIIKLIITGKLNGDKQELNITISDTGKGMKNEQKNSIQNILNNTSETKSTLSVCANYIKLMNGKIWFESDYEVGTKFYIQLEQNIHNKIPLSQVQSKESHIIIDDYSNNNILLINDDKLNAEVLQKILNKYKINVDYAMDLKTGINKIKLNENYDFIIVNNMAKIKSDEILKVMKNIPGYNIGPIVLLTTNEDDNKENFNDVLNMPIELSDLNAIIKKYCKKYIPEENVMQ